MLRCPNNLGAYSIFLEGLEIQNVYQDPVVQSIVSLTSSLVVKMLTVLVI